MFYYLSLKNILGKDFYQIYIISLFVFISALFELISVLMISFIISHAGKLDEALNLFNSYLDFFNSGFLIESLSSLFFIIFSYISISVVSYLIIMRYASYKVFLLVSNVRTKLIYTLLDRDYFYFENNNNSKIVSNIIYDAARFGDSLIDIVHLISRICITVVISGWLLYFNPLITLIMMITLIVLYLAIHFIITPKIKSSGDKIAIFNQMLIKEIANFFGYIREIIFNNIQSKITNELSGINNKIAVSTGSMSYLVNMPRFLVDSLLLIILACLVLIANSNGSNLVEFYTLLATYGIAAIKLFPALQNIFYYTQQLLGRRPSMENLNNFFDVNKDLQKSTTSLKSELITDFKDKINLTEISFKLPNQDILLDDISLDINFSDKVAIVGPSGSGKSILMNIIIGLSNQTSGILKVDGIDINASNVSSYRDQITYIPQKIFLSEATVKENILLFSKESFDEDRYRLAIEESGIKTILEKTDQSENTKISDQSYNLSGGEKQCIGVARALYERKKIIALDEATSSMDFNLSNSVISSILKEWDTVICITHQSYLLKSFSKIIVMHDGQIQDCGTYQDLISRNTYFRNLFSKD